MRKNKLLYKIKERKRFYDENKSWREENGTTNHVYKGHIYKFKNGKIIDYYENFNEYLKDMEI